MTGLAHRVAHWVWWSRAPLALVTRAAMLPLELVYRVLVAARTLAYRRGWLAVRALPLPAVAVGNLSVGGAGKTPVAAWIAAFYARRGLRPGILLRGYGGDEALVHQRLVPGAVVVPDPDRIAGAARARAAGAQVLVLDDAYQLLGVTRDLNVALVNAETASAAAPRSPNRLLPAGPWREPGSALARADLIVVTRRRRSLQEATRLAAELGSRWRRAPVAVVHLAVRGLEGMVSGRRGDVGELAGKRVVAAAGIADPASFAAQLQATGAIVQLLAYQDHHRYSRADIARLARAAAAADYVVVTEKDAVKLRDRWPADVPEPVVAQLGVTWEQNGEAVERALERIATARP